MTEALSTIDAGAIANPLPRDQHPALVYLAGLAPGSRRTMAQALDTIAGTVSGGRCTLNTFPWAAIRYQHTAAIRAALADRYAPATANKALSAFRGVLKQAWRLGQIEGDDYHRAIDLEPVKGSTLPAGRSLSSGELRALFVACSEDPGPAGIRDAALLAVLYAGGLRRSEAVALDLADYDAETGTLTIRGGKGRKDRTSYATNGAKQALDAWLDLRGDEPGALFCPISKTGRLAHRPMTGQALLYILQRRGHAAGVKTFSPHDLRRTFIGDLLNAGADIVTVQKLAGHAKPETTARYDRRGEEVKRQAASMLHVPFEARA